MPLTNTKIKTAPLHLIEYSIVVPVYNSEKSLKELHSRLTDTLKQDQKPYEILYIDDSSADQSWDILCEIGETDDNIRCFQLMRNYGQQNATMCGIHHVKGRYVITIDDDLQYKPEDIPLLINEIKKGFDVVFGIQDTKKQKLWRRLLSFLFQMYYKLTFHYHGRVSAFRILSSDICLQLRSFRSSFVYINGIINWYTTKISSLKIEHQIRPHGKSGYSIKKLLSFFLTIVATYSFFPFRAASILGIALTSAGFILGLFSVIQYSAGGIVNAAVAIFIPVLLLSGLVLLLLGTAGEYMVRINLNFVGKPQYRIRHKYREEQKDQGSN